MPQFARLIEVLGNQSNPVRDVLISNVGFRDTTATFMDPRWAAPSGGDWSLHRGGAVFFEGVENVTVSE